MMKKNRKITIEYCNKLAQKKDGVCLSKKYKSQKKLKWKCKNNHVWETRVDRIQSGRWCMKCYRLSIQLTI